MALFKRKGWAIKGSLAAAKAVLTVFVVLRYLSARFSHIAVGWREQSRERTWMCWCDAFFSCWKNKWSSGTWWDLLITNVTSFVWKRVLFYAFLPVLQTKMPENADENRDFPKRFKSGVLETHRFENAPCQVWIGENGGIGKRWRKKRHILSLPSAFSAVF